MVAGEVVDTSALISWPVGRMKGCYGTPSQKIELNNNYPKRKSKLSLQI